MPSFSTGDMVVLVNASITTSEVGVGCIGTVTNLEYDYVAVVFIADDGSTITQFVLPYMIKHLDEKVVEPIKHHNYDDKEVI